MNNENRLSILAAVVLSASLTSCMRYSFNDKDYTHNTVAEITESTEEGGVVVTTVGYSEWGLGAGADHEFGTNDDDISNYRRVTFDKAGRAINVAESNSGGADGLWFTDDDEQVTLVEMRTDGALEKWTEWAHLRYGQWPMVLSDIVNPPSHQVFFADYAGLNWDCCGRFVSNTWVRFASPIPGNRKFGYWTQYETKYIRKITPAGTEVKSLLSPGYDGEWFTQDDFVGKAWTVVKTETTYEVIEFSNPGNDWIWGNGDDIFSYGLRLQYDGSGNIVLEKHVTNPGVDKVAFNDDDAYVAVIQRSTFSVNSRTYLRQYVRSGHKSGSSEGVPLNTLDEDNSVVLVMDSTFLPGVWKGPVEIYSASSAETVPVVRRRFVERSNSDNVTGVESIQLLDEAGSCTTTDWATLEPCVGAQRAAGARFEIASLRVELAGSRAAKFVDESGYEKYARNFIQIDRRTAVK